MAACANFLQFALTFMVTFIGINCDDISSSVQVNAAYDELYADALRLYFKDDWQPAITKFEEAIIDWKNERKYTVSCRNECKDAFEATRSQGSDSFAMEYVRYLSYMRNCSKACMKTNMGARLKVSRNVRYLFEDRAPYSFMQYAYHKNGNNRMGIQAASTYLRHNPRDEQMKDNMKFYSNHPELQDINVDEIESLAPIEHHELYEKGRKAYNAKDWEKSIEYLEASLKEYMVAYKECQVQCDDETEERQQYKLGGLYGYHMQLLLCRLDCPRKLSMLLNYPQPGYLSKQYDFLHYSYTQLNRLNEALPCAVTNLLLNPLNDQMIYNMKYYKDEKEMSLDAVEPRKEGKYLFEDMKSQMELFVEVKSYLLDLDEEYKGTEDLADLTYETYLAQGLYTDEPNLAKKKPEPKDEVTVKADKDDEPYKRFPPPTKNHIEKFLQDSKTLEGITLTMMEEQLNGSYRAVFDGVASEEECKKLADLGLTLGHAGDGYNDNRSPHTVKEEFLGVNVNNATWAAAKGETSLEKAELYMKLSEKCRQVAEAYFRLTTPLYFTYTHLVCRKALSAQTAKGVHISHPIHSDNCVLKNGKNVTCVKEHPAYVWRDYSAILYLNDNFTGGQFIFARRNQTVEAIVKPKCGRMVAFSAGFENLHGVLGITEGTRCALPLWFTLDQRYDEEQRKDAHKVLRKLREEKESEDKATEAHKEL